MFTTLLKPYFRTKANSGVCSSGRPFSFQNFTSVTENLPCLCFRFRALLKLDCTKATVLAIRRRFGLQYRFSRT
eukprot:1726387-Rhodomonas_salina.1